YRAVEAPRHRLRSCGFHALSHVLTRNGRGHDLPRVPSSSVRRTPPFTTLYIRLFHVRRVMQSTSPGVDPRGLRFAATLTTVVLAVALLTGSSWVLAAQTLVFAVGALAGPAASPYGRLFAWSVRPRLSAPKHLEDAA